jgi:large subunit ribosomal protein L25
MKLKMLTRPSESKSAVKKLRRENSIPAVIYGFGKEAEKIAVESPEFTAHLRSVQPGRLSTTIFTLVDSHGKERRAILKEIQYKVTTYDVIHLDFEELQDKVMVNVKVPIEPINFAECPGVKLGGVLRQVIRHLRVRCLPKDIPQAFVLDAKDMGPRESRRLSDLDIPNTVRPLTNLNEVAAVIVKR